MNRDERIRERAHQIWEAEGRPEGQDIEHWLRARDEVEFDQEGDPQAGGIDSSVAPPLPKATSKPDTTH